MSKQILPIIRFPNPRLRLKSKSVAEVSDEMLRLSEDMLATMYSDNGIGLSAIQVDKPVRLMVIDTVWPEKDKEDSRTELEKKVEQPLVLFNPKIVDKKGKVDSTEGCLSVPTYVETVKRYDWIKLEALDKNGDQVSIEVDGLLSVCMQHEIDHMDGKLFIDRLTPLKSQTIKSKILAQGYKTQKEEA